MFPLGIGKGLVKHFLSQTNTTVVAAIRNTDSNNVSALKQLEVSHGSNLIPVHLDSTSSSGAKNAVSILQSRHGISYIDITIANAGICEHLVPVAEMDVDELIRHVDTNTYGVLRLFQATWPLLQSARAPKFVCISSKLGTVSSSAHNSAPTGAYELSKAAANLLVAKIGAENRRLVAFSIDPG
jgi:norsolorinic acid ketoreductase